MSPRAPVRPATSGSPVPAGAPAFALAREHEPEQHGERRKRIATVRLLMRSVCLRRRIASTPSAAIVNNTGTSAMLMTLSHVPSLVDVGIQVAAHAAQLLANANLLVEEALQLRLLLGAHQQRLPAVVARGLQLAQALLGLRELGLEALLGGAELEVGAAAQLLDGRERPRIGRAAAQADQCRAAREIVERVDDEVAVVGERRAQRWPRKFCVCTTGGRSTCPRRRRARCWRCPSKRDAPPSALR